MHVLAIPSAPLGRPHLRRGSVRWICAVLLVGLSIAAAAISSPVPAVTSPCSVPARLGDGWETIGVGDARLDADALCVGARRWSFWAQPEGRENCTAANSVIVLPRPSLRDSEHGFRRVIHRRTT